MRGKRLRVLLERLQEVAPVSVLFIHPLELRGAHDAVPGATPGRAEEAIRKVLSSLGVPMASTGPALAESFRRSGVAPFGFENTQPGIGHLNAVGHRVIGQALAELLGAARANAVH